MGKLLAEGEIPGTNGLCLRWSPSVGQESGLAKRGSHRLQPPPPVGGSHRDWWLILGFGVVAPRSGDQGTDERGEKLFAPFACIVNELEEPEIDRQLLLGNAPMGS